MNYSLVHFIQNYRGCGGNVEAFNLFRGGEADCRIAGFFNQAAHAFALAAHDNGGFSGFVHLVDGGIGITVHSNGPETGFLQLLNRPGKIGNPADRQVFDGAGRSFGHGSGFRGGIFILHD